MTLLERAKAAGVTLWVEGETLRYRGDKVAVESLLPMLKDHKSELLAALAKPAPAADLGVAAGLDFAATYDDPVLGRYDAAWKRRAAAEPGFEPTAEARYCCECSNLAPDKRCTAWQRLGASAGWEPSDKAPRKCRGFVPARDGGEITLNQASDLRECFEERAAIFELDAGLSRSEAELEAARITATYARNVGYSWTSLWMAFEGNPELVAALPEKAGPVDSLPLGVSKLAVLPWKPVPRQGAFTGAHERNL